MSLWSVSGIDEALDGITANFLSLHTSDPSTTGAHEIVGGSYVRVATTWSPASAGTKAGSPVTINVPSNTTITHFGIWDSLSNGVYKRGGKLGTPVSFTGAGGYVLSPLISGSG